VCVILCTVFRLIVVLFYVMCVVCVLCLIVVPLPPGENPYAVKINNNNNYFGFAANSKRQRLISTPTYGFTFYTVYLYTIMCYTKLKVRLRHNGMHNLRVGGF
jgi:hypothetical protein